MTTGFTPAEIDEMTLFDVLALFSYWRENPPTHEILKAVYRIEPKREAPRASPDDPSGIGELIMLFPSGQVPARK